MSEFNELFKFRPRRDCDQNGNTNKVRADRALGALNAYAEGNYAGPPYDDTCIIQDLICDLFHLRDCMIAKGTWDHGDVSHMVEHGHSCYEEER